MSTVEQAGQRPGAETMTIIPGFRAAQIDLNSALTVMERMAYAVAQERDAAVREREEALRELGKLRARVEELEQSTADPVLYLLWSDKHDAWWKPDARGYTADVDHAGRYTRDEALKHVHTSAQCGIREQVTSMVAAPENWTATRG